MLLEIAGYGVARARHAEPGDEIYEATGVRHGGLQSSVVGCRRHESNQIECALRHRLLHGWIRARREVGEQHAGDARGVGVTDKALDAIRHHRIQIGHEDDRNLKRGLVHQLEDARQGHALFERGLRGSLNRGPVGKGIGERHSHFDKIGARRDDAAQRVE